jgi:hypothetical protein
MKQSHTHWRALNLKVPVCGRSDPWLGGRKNFEMERHLMETLPLTSGLIGGSAGEMTDRGGTLLELNFHFWYEDLERAVLAFRDAWASLRFPDRTRLTHVERFPDCSFQHHVLIRWIEGRMDPFSSQLRDDVILGPHNG